VCLRQVVVRLMWLVGHQAALQVVTEGEAVFASPALQVVGVAAKCPRTPGSEGEAEFWEFCVIPNR